MHGTCRPMYVRSMLITSFAFSTFSLQTRKPLTSLKYKSRTRIAPQTFSSAIPASFRKDGKYFAVALDMVPKVWDTRTGEECLLRSLLVIVSWILNMLE